MAFRAAIALVVLSAAVISGQEKCDFSSFDAVHTCMNGIFGNKMKCFSDSGCTPPTHPPEVGNKTKCHQTMHNSVKDKFAACVNKTVPGFVAPKDPPPFGDHGGDHEKGPSSAEHQKFVLDACNGDAAKAAKVKDCWTKKMCSIKDCFKPLSKVCMEVLPTVMQAGCGCFNNQTIRDSIKTAFQSDPTDCKGDIPFGDNKQIDCGKMGGDIMAKFKECPPENH